MWILSSLVITLELLLFGRWNCHDDCRSGDSQKLHCLALQFLSAQEASLLKELAEPVTAKTWIGDIVLSGVMEPQDSGVCALAKVAMVIGDIPCSKFIRASAEVFDFTGVMEAFGGWWSFALGCYSWYHCSACVRVRTLCGWTCDFKSGCVLDMVWSNLYEVVAQVCGLALNLQVAWSCHWV